MSWLTEFVRPKIRTLFAKRDVPENLWHQCPACQQMIFHRDLATGMKVCGHCGRTASNGLSCIGMCVADSGY